MERSIIILSWLLLFMPIKHPSKYYKTSVCVFKKQPGMRIEEQEECLMCEREKEERKKNFDNSIGNIILQIL